MQRLVGRALGQVKAPLYRNAFFIMLSSVIGSGLGFFFWLLVARYYRETDVGYAVALFQTLSFLGGLGVLGLGIALVRFLPEADEKVGLVNTSLTVIGVACLLLAALFLVLVLGLANVEGSWAHDLSFILQSPVYIVLVFLVTIAAAFAPVYDQTAFAMRRADLQTWRTLFFAVLKLPFAVGFALIPLTSGRLGVFMALTVPFVLSIVLQGLWLTPRVLPGYRPRPSLAIHRLRPMVHFSLGNYLATVIGSAATMLLPLIILQALGPTGAENVSYFYIASVVAGLLYIIPGATFTSFYAEASQLNANRHADERKAILLSLGLLAPGIVVLWVYAEQLLSWFGNPKYAIGAVGALHILVFASVPVFLNAILSTRIRIRKRSLPLVIGSSLTTAVTLGLGYVLLQQGGIDGLALAFVIGNAASTPYYYLVARKSFAAEPVEPLEPSGVQV